MSVINLDDPKILAKYDKEDMLAGIGSLPEQCRQAWQAATDFGLPFGGDDIDKIVVLGMGGSAIGGDLVRGLAGLESGTPVIVHRGYELPSFVDDRTLLIASSYSGDTEETLAAFNASLRTGARKLAVTTGGRLGELARVNGIPVFEIAYRGQPRAAIGWSFLPMLCFLQKLGMVGDKSGDVAEMLGVIEEMITRMDASEPTASNPAKTMARWLYGSLAVIYGAEILAEVAHRWKTQINENGKAWAFYEVLPELNHNSIVGYHLPEDVSRQIKVVLLCAPTFDRRVGLRCKVTCELLEKAGVACQFVDSGQGSALSQMMGLVLFGDYVSCYLGILNRADPTPVEVIGYLKERLAKGE